MMGWSCPSFPEAGGCLPLRKSLESSVLLPGHSWEDLVCSSLALCICVRLDTHLYGANHTCGCICVCMYIATYILSVRAWGCVCACELFKSKTCTKPRFG